MFRATDETWHIQLHISYHHRRHHHHQLKELKMGERSAIGPFGEVTDSYRILVSESEGKRTLSIPGFYRG